jgi:hypothetical protein
MSDEAAFKEALLAACREMSALAYVPTYYLHMIHEQGACETARRLVRSGELQTGFRTLARHGRLDLSVEGIMTRPEFAGLFGKQDLEAATWRLAEVNKSKKGG